ncbi:Transposon Ty3-G Gag-Pol polyprotein [Cucumis melo var. makuwa]|uniref:Transposon Ty3-G Gag-Pol polyprotein n=1 Tax=Cucumis melo var. makuwa TaxID=1194695 RepID=A0A5D3C2H5_CUCMM|nr:Transposon Ty3-G Gag-Pol polyprotein [Cucumis melo var. makuwa]
MFRLAGTKLNKSIAYYPQSDGQTEVVNKGLETYLWCFYSEKPKEWLSWLMWAEFWYNTTFQRALRVSPFKVVYGHKPPLLLSHEASEDYDEIHQSFPDLYLEEKVAKHEVNAKDMRPIEALIMVVSCNQASQGQEEIGQIYGLRNYLKVQLYGGYCHVHRGHVIMVSSRCLELPSYRLAKVSSLRYMKSKVEIVVLAPD